MCLTEIRSAFPPLRMHFFRDNLHEHRESFLNEKWTIFSIHDMSLYSIPDFRITHYCQEFYVVPMEDIYSENN